MDMLHGQAMKFALEIEDFEGQMKLLRLRQSALLQTKAGTELREILESLQTEEKNVWAKMRNLRKWERLISKRFIAKTIKQQEREHLIQSILNHPLVVNDGPCLSIKAEIARLTLKEKLIGIDKLNMPDRIPILLQIAALIESNGSLMEDAQVVERFLFATFNAGLLAGDARRDEEMSMALKMLERFGASRPDTEVLVFERVEMIKFIRTLDDLDIEGAERVSKRIRKGLDSFGDRLSLQLRAEFINQLSFFYLLKAKNSHAAKILNPKFGRHTDAGQSKKESAPVDNVPDGTSKSWKLGGADLVRSPRTKIPYQPQAGR